MAVHTIDDLRQMQALPLNLKIRLTQDRIRGWLDEYDAYVSFSGGKDSTVLLHLVREIDKSVPAVFCDTGLEYPEIRDFVKTFDNVKWLKPKMNFRKVIETYGYPFISKEVSECVQGARKYLTSITASESVDRQTDRQKVTCAYAIADLIGVDRRADKENDCYHALKMGAIPKEELLAMAHLQDPNHIYAFETNRILGTTDWYKAIKQADPRAIDKLPARMKILLGIYPHKEKGVLTGEYSNQYDKSRYAFFLESPFEISNKCCSVMKKTPFKQYAKETGRFPIMATMAQESRLRTAHWLKTGCNAFNAKTPRSAPMSFWTEQDVLEYIKKFNLPICSVYGDIVEDDELAGQMTWSEFDDKLKAPKLKTTGCNRTGCMFCGYGCHLEKEGEGRFERMKVTHPKQYEWIMKPWKDGGLGYKEVIDWINEHGNLHIRY